MRSVGQSPWGPRGTEHTLYLVLREEENGGPQVISISLLTLYSCLSERLLKVFVRHVELL